MRKCGVSLQSVRESVLCSTVCCATSGLSWIASIVNENADSHNAHGEHSGSQMFVRASAFESFLLLWNPVWRFAPYVFGLLVVAAADVLCVSFCDSAAYHGKRAFAALGTLLVTRLTPHHTRTHTHCPSAFRSNARVSFALFVVFSVKRHGVCRVN